MPEPKVDDDGDGATHPFAEIAGDAPPETEAELLRWRAAYFACVEYLDEVLGDFLALLEDGGFLENTVVVYTSDHGEMAGEHGMLGKLMWHEASARVPLVVQTPAQRSGDVDPHAVETPASLVDLFPTLCGLCDVSKPDELDGFDLSEAVRTGAEPEREPVFSDNLSPYNWGPGTEFRMVRDGRWKYVHHRDYPDALFDLAEDPDEQQNLLPDPTGDAADAHARLRRLVEETIDWERLEERRMDDEQVVDDRNMGIVRGILNAYHLPDGRIVEADTPLYHPNTIAENPDQLINDYPEESGFYFEGWY